MIFDDVMSYKLQVLGIVFIIDPHADPGFLKSGCSIPGERMPRTTLKFLN